MSGSNEGFYLDGAGKKQDASIHEPILKAGKLPPAPIYARAKALGLTEDQIKLLYPKL